MGVGVKQAQQKLHVSLRGRKKHKGRVMCGEFYAVEVEGTKEC